MLWFAPRKAASGWSAINKRRVEKMIVAKQMTDAGLQKVEAAKKDGSWFALDAIERLEIPEDLETGFSLYPDSRRKFDAFPRSVKRGILEWLAGAKKPETRRKRITEIASLAARNIRANQWRTGKSRQ